jgi:hypothetical protein
VIRTKETVERHEEEEEESDVVDLLAGPLEDLVQPRLPLSLRIIAHTFSLYKQSLAF